VALTSKNAKTGQRYLALFNLSDKSDNMVSVNISDLGLNKVSKITDLWQSKVVPLEAKQIAVNLKPHTCILYEVK